jgi:hypothetical protein
MNSFVGSAAKAYANGFVNSTSATAMKAAAIVQEQRFSLTTSKALWIVNLVLASTTLLAILVAVRCSDAERVLFNLKNVMKVL